MKHWVGHPPCARNEKTRERNHEESEKTFLRMVSIVVSYDFTGTDRFPQYSACRMTISDKFAMRKFHIESVESAKDT